MFTVCLLIVNFVGDGGPQKSAGLLHQLLLLPVTGFFLYCLWKLLSVPEHGTKSSFWTIHRALLLAVFFEVMTAALFFYEAHHFAGVGYRLFVAPTVLFFLAMLTALIFLVVKRDSSSRSVFAITLAGYIGGVLLSIASFPLTYLRSDMMPVIQWAGKNLLHHVDPYSTIYVADRVYNFPYLPGMIVGYLPFIAVPLDIRFASVLFNAISATLLYRTTDRAHRREVAALLVLFFLSPFLQYRHELYISPHWLTLVGTFVLMHRRRFLMAALVCGIGMAIYQFSWLIFPFLLLHAYRRRGALEVVKIALAGIGGALLLAGPFLKSASHRILNDTVTQWGEAAHADAMPMNLSYWVTFLLHPSALLKLQALLMVAVFSYAVWKRRCSSFEDTLRFIVIALTVFILLNVLVDGYFYLMLLIPMLVFVCVANGWWREPKSAPLIDALS